MEYNDSSSNILLYKLAVYCCTLVVYPMLPMLSGYLPGLLSLLLYKLHYLPSYYSCYIANAVKLMCGGTVLL